MTPENFKQFITWLGQGDCHDCTLVGGKGANLCHLATQHRIPPGFCLTAEAFDQALASGLTLEEKVDPTQAFPPALYSELAAAYQRLGERCGVDTPSVAVRSSALDEDSNTASFAGQHETYLNITGIEAIAAAVVRCWRSLHAERALAYRRQHGLTHA